MPCRSEVLWLLCARISPLAPFASFYFFTSTEHLNSFINAQYIPHKCLQLDSIADVYVFATKYPSPDRGTPKCTLICITPFIAPNLPGHETSESSLIYMTPVIAPTRPSRGTLSKQPIDITHSSIQLPLQILPFIFSHPVIIMSYLIIPCPIQLFCLPKYFV